MAVIYSYPDNPNLRLTDMLIGTSTIMVNGRKKNITKNFTLEALGDFMSANFGPPSAPTLQQVTLNGAITETTVYLNGGAYSDSVNEQSLFIPNAISTVNKNTGSGVEMSSLGYIALSPDGVASGIFGAEYITSEVTLQFPNKPSGTYFIATVDDLSTGYVPYIGATTDLDLGNKDLYVNEIFLYDGPNDNYGSIHYTDGNFHIEDGDGHPLLVIEDEFVQIHKSATIQSNLWTSGLSATRDHYLPNQSGTIALTSDIPSLTGYVQDTRTISTSAPLSGGGDLSANRTLSITQATTSTDGFLSSTNWNTFNNKFTLPALTSGSVLFSNGTTIAQDNANFFWDDTNNRLGIGTATPAYKLTVAGTIDAGTNLIGNGVWNQGIQGLGGAGETRFVSGTGGGFFFTWVQNNGVERMRLSSNNNLLIGTSTDAGFKLDVNGTARVKGAGATSATTAFTVQNSASATGLTVFDNGNVSVGSSSNSFYQLFGNGSWFNSGTIYTPIFYTNYIEPAVGGSNRIYANANNIKIGTTATATATAIFEIDSTTKGFLPPRMTTTQKNAIATPAAGLVVYDTTLGKQSTYNGTVWDNLQPIIAVLDTTDSATVSGSVETLAKTYQIVGGTFKANDFFKLIVAAKKTGGNSSSTVRVKVNTTNDFATSTLIATSVISPNTSLSSAFARFRTAFSGGNLEGIQATGNFQSDLGSTTAANFSTPLNVANDIWVFISLQNSSGTVDTSTIDNVQITN